MTGSRHRVILDGGHDSTPNIKLNLPSEHAATLQHSFVCQQVLARHPCQQVPVFQRVVLKNKVPRFLAMVGVPIEEKQKGKKIHRHRPQIEKVGTDGSQRLPWQGTAGSQTLELTVPNLRTRGYHCKELPVPKS